MKTKLLLFKSVATVAFHRLTKRILMDNLAEKIITNTFTNNI